MQHPARVNRMDVVMRILAPVLLAASLAACSSSVPSPSPSASATPASSAAAATGARELVDGAGLLPAGRYTSSGFLPSVTFEVAEGWSVRSVRDGYLAISRALEGGQVVELLIVNVDAVVDANGQEIAAPSAEAVAQFIREDPEVAVIGSSGSRMSGRDGFTLELENATTARRQLLTTSSERLGIEPGGRLWLSLFDTADGLLGIAIASPRATWDEALSIAEPLLESVTIEG
jgi:hypothetical protein